MAESIKSSFSTSPTLKPPNTSISTPTLKSKTSIGEKVASFIFDGPSTGENARNVKDLSEKWDEDKRDDIPRTEKEEKERQKRIKKRSEIMRGRDGLRTNDMAKGGWGGAMMGQQ